MRAAHTCAGAFLKGVYEVNHLGACTCIHIREREEHRRRKDVWPVGPRPYMPLAEGLWPEPKGIRPVYMTCDVRP